MRRILKFGLLAVLAAVVLTLAAGSFSRWRLQRKIESLQNAGDPASLQDLFKEEASDSENAGPDIIAAAASINRDERAVGDFNRDVRLPLTSEERTAIRAALERNRESIDRLMMQSGKRSDWPPASKPPTGSSYYEELNSLRSVSRLLADAVLSSHDAMDAESVKRLETMLWVSHFAGRYPALYGRNVADDSALRAANTIVDSAPDIRIGNDRLAASPEVVRHLIETLLDDESAQHGLVRALQGERMALGAEFSTWRDGGRVSSLTTARGTPWFGPVRALMTFWVAGDVHAMIDRFSAAMPLANESDWPTVRLQLDWGPEDSFLGTNMATASHGPAVFMAMERHFRVMTELRLAAAALAVRWYASEHNGRLPRQWEDLTPRYLPTAPIDPQASGGRRLVLVPDEARPIVYSVGDNGVDDHGSEISDRIAQDAWYRADRVVHLARQPRVRAVTR